MELHPNSTFADRKDLAELADKGDVAVAFLLAISNASAIRREPFNKWLKALKELEANSWLVQSSIEYWTDWKLNGHDDQWVQDRIADDLKGSATLGRITEYVRAQFGEYLVDQALAGNLEVR